MRPRDVNARIERLGGRVFRQVGSHRRYVLTVEGADRRITTLFTTVPQRRGDIPAGTLRAIARDLEPVWGKGG
jgi:predicted RNA binding protein YcfA (HicA-like mRNA interferase family)